MSILPPLDGRVIITWPASDNGRQVPGWGVTVQDADTGEQLLDATSLVTVAHGSPDSWDSGPLHVTLTRLVDAEGKPIGAGRAPVPTDEIHDGQVHTFTPEEWAEREKARAAEDGKFRTGTFRYLVAEMRIAPVDPTVPTRESVNRGEHTINQYREHHGIAEPYPWELLGVQPGPVIASDPDAVLVVSYPDDWPYDRIADLADRLKENFPTQRIVVVTESLRIRLDQDPGGNVEARVAALQAEEAENGGLPT